MKKMKFGRILPVVAATLVSSISPASRFTGGLCISQGNWLQAALQQSDVISNAISSLQNDPNCKGLTDALRNLPRYEQGQVQDPETNSFANLSRELQALGQFMRPDSQALGMSAQEFQNIVFHTAFNKSYDSIRDVQNSSELSKLSDFARFETMNVSLRVKAFLRKSKDVANMTMSTASSVLGALPNSELCLHNNPSVAAALFGAIAHSAASLTSGGEINGVGRFVGDLLDYSRNMKYVKSLKPMELERFHNSVSCLIESTSEAYCSINDAELTLNLMKDNNLAQRQVEMLNKVILNPEQDIVASPLAGLVLMMRDIPVIQGWMQKVLFGVNPKISAEATMKNDYWGSYVMFIQSINSLMADFNDKEQLYYATTKGQNVSTKLSQVKDIMETTLGNLYGGPKQGINFFSRAMQPETIPFFLLGLQMPTDFNVQTKNFDTFWLLWSQDQTNGFNDPDQLLKMIRNRLWDLMDRAQIQANEFFATRMIVDPQNLMTEAMKGPGVSPYQGFVNLRHYFKNLIVKLKSGAVEISKNPLQEARAHAQVAQIPLIENSIERIDKILSSLKEVGQIGSRSLNLNGQSEPELSAHLQSQVIMSAIYETANMMVSRDSLFGTRMATILQADISDTLYRNRKLSPEQRDYFLAVGPKIVSELSGYFAVNPVNQRADISAAKMAHLKNLESVESLFAKNLFGRIAEINCMTEGGYACEVSHGNVDVTDRQVMSNVNDFIRKSRQGKGLYFRWVGWLHKPTEDSAAHQQVKAKLCIQALAFKSRNHFEEICRDAVLVSDFADTKDSFALNMDYNKTLATVQGLSTSDLPNRIDASRTAGVCALRSYLRKNHVFYMYREYMEKR